jgi:hypothetical protein
VISSREGRRIVVHAPGYRPKQLEAIAAKLPG